MFLGRYQHKVKTASEIAELIKSLPRDKKVVMCHGVFDVVHPGHVRHLMYAKSRADILVASLTADHHITKGCYRPHVPQNIRAANLAVFEMVDYVLIDENPTPIENIKLLKPDFFAKGYEYNDKKSEKTREEEVLIAGYGGKMLFTPGDVVYSSSSLITSAEPVLRSEKLAALMESDGITMHDLLESLEERKRVRIHVVGDTIVDGIMQTNVIGGQIKTPTLSLRYEAQKNYVGGAAVVAKHLKAAGAEVIFTTVLGEDPLAQFVLDDLLTYGIEVNVIVDKNRPTTYKNAIVANEYRLVKVDTLDNSSISNEVLRRFTEKIASVQAEAIIFSDFRHGIFNRRTIASLIAAVPKACFKVADSQVASRWGNITDFRGFDLITPNEREARFALADQDSGIRPLASDLYRVAECKLLILKLGGRGLLTYFSKGASENSTGIVLDSFADRIVDAVGSGDALLAYATLTLLRGFTPAIASIIGSMAAACECEVNGNIPVTKEAVIKKVQWAINQCEYSLGPFKRSRSSSVGAPMHELESISV